MTIAGTKSPFVYLVQMDIPAEQETDFNRVYDQEHVPELLKVPGVLGCSRFLLERTNKQGFARYLALYEVETPEVIDSPAWTEAAEKGSWVPQIRPHTTNRSHTVMRRIG